MYGSIFWWVIKVGMAGSIALGGVMLNATGFDIALEAAQSDTALFWMRVLDAVVPAAASLLAIYVLYSYEITEDKAYEIRNQLQSRKLQS